MPRNRKVSGVFLLLFCLFIYNNIDIYIAGLDLTSELTPFNIMPNILAIATEVYKLKARCQDCGKEAEYTYCLVEKNEEVMVGNSEYVPLCRDCLGKRLTLRRDSYERSKTI